MSFTRTWSWALSDDGRRNLAATVLALAEVLQPGWGIRAYWLGDTLEREEPVTARALAERVRQSRLDRYTLYRVES